MSFETDLMGWLYTQYNGSPQTLSAEFHYIDAGDATLPFGVVDVTERDSDYHVDATSQLKHITVDFNCFAGTALGAQQLGAELLAILDGKLDKTIGSTRLERAVKVADYDDFEELSQSYYRLITLIIGYK